MCAPAQMDSTQSRLQWNRLRRSFREWKAATVGPAHWRRLPARQALRSGQRHPASGAECNSGPAPAMQAARRPWRPSCLFLPPLPLRPGRCRHARHQWLHDTAGRPPAAETPLRMQRHFPALVKKLAMLLARETPKKQRQPRKNKARESFGERNSSFVWFVASFSGAWVYNVLP